MKQLIFLIVIFSLMMTLSACFERDDKQSEIAVPIIVSGEDETKESQKTEKEPIYKAYSSNLNLDDLLDRASEQSGLNKDHNISVEEAKNLYGLEEYEQLDVLVRKNGSDEIAIIKIPNTDETLNILEKISSRIGNLNVNTSDNNSFVMEVNDGILTIVICDNAKQISDEITSAYKVVE